MISSCILLKEDSHSKAQWSHVFYHIRIPFFYGKADCQNCRTHWGILDSKHKYSGLMSGNRLLFENWCAIFDGELFAGCLRMDSASMVEICFMMIFYICLIKLFLIVLPYYYHFPSWFIISLPSKCNPPGKRTSSGTWANCWDKTVRKPQKEQLHSDCSLIMR